GRFDFVDVPAFASNGKRIMGHGFFAEYAGQQRGYTLLSAIIQELQNLTDFTTSEIKRAIAQSQIMGFVKPSQDKAASDVLGQFTQKIAQGTVSGTGGTIGTSSTESQELGISPLFEATISQPGQMFINTLDGGESITFPQMTSPSANFETFVTEFWTHLGAARSMPPEVMRMKFSSNYSASRAALLMYWQVIEIWRQELVTDFLGEVWEAWLDEEIAAGRVAAPGWSDPRMRAAWLNATWFSLPLPHIDPKKEADAAKSWLEIGATNQEREARAHNGSSAAANIATNKKMFADTPSVPWAKKRGEQ
ncbi:MAG: phage portal protein, partial [Thermoguttaceae bacterium]